MGAAASVDDSVDVHGARKLAAEAGVEWESQFDDAFEKFGDADGKIPVAELGNRALRPKDPEYDVKRAARDLRVRKRMIALRDKVSPPLNRMGRGRLLALGGGCSYRCGVRACSGSTCTGSERSAALRRKGCKGHHDTPSSLSVARLDLSPPPPPPPPPRPLSLTPPSPSSPPPSFPSRCAAKARAKREASRGQVEKIWRDGKGDGSGAAAASRSASAASEEEEEKKT